MYLCIEEVRQITLLRITTLKMEQKDDILEQQIKFREELLRQYIEINKIRNGGKQSKNEVIDHALDELGKLYKRRKK